MIRVDHVLFEVSDEMRSVVSGLGQYALARRAKGAMAEAAIGDLLAQPMANGEFELLAVTAVNPLEAMTVRGGRPAALDIDALWLIDGTVVLWPRGITR